MNGFRIIHKHISYGNIIQCFSWFVLNDSVQNMIYYSLSSLVPTSCNMRGWYDLSNLAIHHDLLYNLIFLITHPISFDGQTFIIVIGHIIFEVIHFNDFGSRKRNSPAPILAGEFFGMELWFQTKQLFESEVG